MEIEKISGNILYYLQQKGMAQVDLANGLHTSTHVVNKMVHGKKALKIQELDSIAACLGISLDELINREHHHTEERLEVAQLSEAIGNPETAAFIMTLVSNLSEMETELAAHGLRI